MKNFTRLFSFFSLLFVYQFGNAQCTGATELSLCDPIIVSSTDAGFPSNASCSETTNCAGLVTEYFIVDLNNIVETLDEVGVVATSGPEILGTAPAGMIDLAAYTGDAEACVSVVPICYDLSALQSLVSNMVLGSNCCAVIESAFAGVCQTVSDLGFDGANPPMNLADVTTVINAFNTDDVTGEPLPISIDFFASVADGVNEQQGILSLFCGGGSSVPIGYCTDQTTGADYNIVACPLSIDLTSLEATNTTDGNELKWTTETEVENDYFIIERSYNGETYEEIGMVEAAGNSNSIQQYTFNDEKVVGRLNYYRIVAVSYASFKQFSNVVAVETETVSVLDAVNIAPNPVRSTFTLSFDSDINGSANIIIVDATGKRLVDYTIDVVVGYNQIEEQLSNLNSGLYMAIIQIGDNVATEKFMKL